MKSHSFTTEPKSGLYIKRGHNIIRERCYQIMADLWPAEKITYAALDRKMFNDYNFCGDPRTRVKYLGRPQQRRRQQVNLTTRYHRTGTTVPRDLNIVRVLPSQQGYLQKLGLVEPFLEKKTGQLSFKLLHENVPKPYHYIEGLDMEVWPLAKKVVKSKPAVGISDMSE